MVGRSVTAAVMNRLLVAMNADDLDAFVACFAPTTAATSRPPSRAFYGSDQVRENWASVFAGVPDFNAELVVSSHHRDGIEIGDGAGRGRTPMVRLSPCAESR